MASRRSVRRRRSAKRRAQARDDNILRFGLLAGGVILAGTVLARLLHHPLLLLLLLTAVLAVVALVVRRRVAAARREHHAQVAQLRHIGAFLAMGPKDFEHALATLCRRDGCTKVTVTVIGGAGDLAASDCGSATKASSPTSGSARSHRDLRRPGQPPGPFPLAPPAAPKHYHR